MSELSKRFPRYSKLLRLYPGVYRAQYGEQMLQTLADMLDDAPGKKQKLTIWARTSLDLALSLGKQQLSYAGAVMTSETPNYVKRNALAGAMLLVPFVLVLLANATDKVLHNHTLYNSWLWSQTVLTIWVLVLPALALLLSFVTFVVWTKQRNDFWHSLIDIRHNWPMLLVGLAGLFIVALVFGHDSVHCITGNPIREMHNWHDTWQCIQQR